MTIYIVDRKTEKKIEEIVYGESLLQLVYKQTIFSKCLRALISRLPLASYLFGIWQKTSFSKKQIAPFVKKFAVNLDEAEKKEYSTFNDFFIRKLKKGTRPISKDEVVAPADGRYLAYNKIELHEQIFVKGKKLSIAKLLKGDASRYKDGALLIARLAPPDYHRFHSPIDCIPSIPRQIGGYLYSVNPVSLKSNIDYLSENKRVVIDLQNEKLGLISFIAVGATNVGSINFTYQPKKILKKGDELGYFSFGASMVIVLFEPEKVTFSPDLIKNTKAGMETLLQMGESIITC